MEKKKSFRAVSSIICCLFLLSLFAGFDSGAAGETELSNPAPASTANAVSEGETISLPVKGTLGEKFGVAQSQFQLSDNETIVRVLSEMRNAGIGWIRVSFCWHHIEPNEGAPDYSRHDFVVNEANALGIKVLGILGGTPKWASPAPVPDPALIDPITYYFISLPYYENTYWAFPPDQDSIQAWRDHVSATALRYKGKVAAWEIGNEENIDTFWRPTPNAADYVAFVKETTPQIKAVDPAAKVIMGGLAGLGSDFMYNSFENGIADLAENSNPPYSYVDAIAFHPYPEAILFNNYLPNEDYMRGWGVMGYVRNQISTHCPPQKTPQIWLTELGWTNTTPTIDEATQAAYMMRTFINYATESVDKVFYYNLWDESTGAYASLYGLLRNDFSKKPSWYYYRTFMETYGKAVSAAPDIATYTSSNSLAAQLENHAFYLKDGRLVIGLWNRANNTDSIMAALKDACWANPVTVDPLTGASQVLSGSYRDAHDKLVLPNIAIGKAPVIIILERPAVFTAAAGSPAVINSSDGYIHGIEPGTSSLEGLVTVAEGYAFSCVPATGGISTRTVVNITKNGITVESYTVIIFGDVNGDGNIDSNDAGLIADYENYSVAWNPVDDAVLFKAGDLNGDGNVDSNDAGLMVEVENYNLTVDQRTGLAG